MSVSLPSCCPSVQVAAHLLLVHTPPLQSPFIAQVLLNPHPGQVPPPQSMSVSAPSVTPSVQVAVAHTVALQ